MTWTTPLPLSPVPAEGFHKNPGAYPDMIPPDTQLQVQFTSDTPGMGYIDKKHTYTPRQLHWRLTGRAWDVGAVREA